MNKEVTEFIKDKTLINGQWLEAISGKKYPVFNPATGEQIVLVPDMGQADTRLAIEKAEQAQKLWLKQTAKQRSIILKRWAQLVEAHLETLATILTLEQGKSLAEAKGEVTSSINYIDWFANEAMRVNGDVLPPSAAGNFEFVKKRAVGVVAAITPWNFPNSMIARKVAPALAAGCSVVIKPAEDTPLSALALAALAEQAGIPAGVLNVITASSGHEVGQELCANPIVRKLSFTGSTEVGKILSRQCADTVKKLSLELGGNAPFMVFDDADLDAAVQGAIAIKFYNSGQTCICANRLLVQDGVYEAFIAKLQEALGKLRLGNGLQPDSTHGPLINEKAIRKVSSIVNKAVEQGARLVQGGAHLPEIGKQFFNFTILADVTPEMDVFKTEIFGPVAAVYRFKSEEEAIRLANSTNYGLAAYAYTEDKGRIFRLSDQMEYGMLGINTPRFVSETVPFGGVKESGVGREGSVHGIDEFLEMHYVCIKN
ncbi:NAD-dependent succinate-semialdehyde dehydrogenase [Advenella alkanexedens]|uniref:NAD-dependent succinate-semialdehyde dehydrogenase n=1 Tax=Advenella alkanexedens TaxID=1481665 RepID=A0ABS6NP13_9BURK|nr:NAD-dependent succinate-semialdehyde dehydrogenase [Advenella alkanexedens]MBV4396926.1 NAD-dependent succinate-semialdehyde dehydrogenase [Advenella alkanexedens]